MHTPARLMSCLLLLLLALSGLAVAAEQAFRLQDFEEGLASHPDYALLAADLEIADAQARAAAANGGARLYGIVGAANTYEPQFGGGSRDYNSLLGGVGVRYPLLGSASEDRLKVGHARIDALLVSARRETLLRRLQQDLRRSFYGYARSQAQLALSRQYLADAAHIRHALTLRVRAGLLLEGEQRELELGLAQASRQLAAITAERSRLAAELRRWRSDFNGLVDTRSQTTVPLAVDDAIITNALQALQGLQQELSDAADYAALRSHAYIVGNVRQDNDLGRNTSLNAGLSLDIPFEAGEYTRNVRRESMARVQRARSLLDQLRNDTAAWRDSLQQEQDAALAELSFARDSVSATARSLREATARAQLAAGVAEAPIERWVRARNAHYNALSSLLAAEARARSDDLALTLGTPTGGCALPETALFAWASLAGRPPAATDCQARGARRAVYAWGGMAALEQPASLDALRQFVAQEIWLSFSAEEIKRLAESTQRQKLSALIRQQQAQGRRVVLLLGDPDWLRGGRGDDLLRMVKGLAGLPFDGLHLDLEPDQLSAAERTPEAMSMAWQALEKLLIQLRAQTTLSLGISVHWRYLTPDANSGCAACSAATAADSVAVMLYSTATESVRSRLRRIAAALPGKSLWLAQSIEAALPPEESHHASGRGSALRFLDGLQSLADEGIIVGFALQSLADFQSSPP